jgi:membrane dipeptidase
VKTEAMGTPGAGKPMDPEVTDLHAGAVVVDGTCPDAHWLNEYQTWREGGTTCCVVTVASTEDMHATMTKLGRFFRFVREHADEILMVTGAEDIRAAKADGRLGVLIQFQGTDPIEYDIDLLEVYRGLGVRVIQLAYNRRCPVADGCEEPTDSGLSRFGRRVVEELNRLGIVVDVSHTGRRSSHEAIVCSDAPVIASHSNAYAVHPSPRNLHDDLIRAIGDGGGLVGVNGFPAFVAETTSPTLDQYIDHIDHVASISGTDNVALGIDYWMRNPPVQQYEEFITSGLWGTDSYPPPPWHYPNGLDDASHLPSLTRRLLERGYKAEEVRAILGGNWLRVLDEVQRGRM